MFGGQVRTPPREAKAVQRKPCISKACRDGECFVTDDRFRFLSIRTPALRIGVFDAESSVN
jgi:hypothetical protein